MLVSASYISLRKIVILEAALISTPLPSPERKPCDSSLKGRSMKANARAASLMLLKARVKLLVKKFFNVAEPARTVDFN